jgi:hypothetical protein
MRANIENFAAMIGGCLLLCSGPILAALGWIGN